jgi:hypothetical protein
MDDEKNILRVNLSTYCARPMEMGDEVHVVVTDAEGQQLAEGFGAVNSESRRNRKSSGPDECPTEMVYGTKVH